MYSNENINSSSCSSNKITLNHQNHSLLFAVSVKTPVGVLSHKLFYIHPTAFLSPLPSMDEDHEHHLKSNLII